MNIDAVQTFLELSRLGNFSRVAAHLNITQSTVSARIKVLEDHLSARLFTREHAGVTLTPEGRQFYRYAASMVQLWQQGRHELRTISAFGGSIGIGVHITMWRRFMPAWLIWMRRNHPDLALHVEADYSERLTDYVQQGVLNLAITHMPKALPGLVIEDFCVDRLVLASSEPRDFASCQDHEYLHVDWSYGYREEHAIKAPGLQSSRFNIGYGEIALEYLLAAGGIAYLPAYTLSGYLEDGRLFAVENAPELSRPSYLIYSENPSHPDRVQAAIAGLRASLEGA